MDDGKKISEILDITKLESPKTKSFASELKRKYMSNDSICTTDMFIKSNNLELICEYRNKKENMITHKIDLDLFPNVVTSNGRMYTDKSYDMVIDHIQNRINTYGNIEIIKVFPNVYDHYIVKNTDIIGKIIGIEKREYGTTLKTVFNDDVIHKNDIYYRIVPSVFGKVTYDENKKCNIIDIESIVSFTLIESNLTAYKF